MRFAFLVVFLFAFPAQAITFDEAVDVVIGIENGYNPDDPSMYGITQETLQRIGSDKSVMQITPENARAIYREHYWQPIRGDDLPDGLDLAVFDMAVNMGVENAIATLQQILSVTVDGRMGPQTLNAVSDDCGLILDFNTRRAVRYAAIEQTDHHAGWFNRLLFVHDQALQACRDPA